MFTGRSYDPSPRRRRPGIPALALAGAMMLSAAALAVAGSAGSRNQGSERTWPPVPYPSGDRVDAARAESLGEVARDVGTARGHVGGGNEPGVGKPLLQHAEGHRDPGGGVAAKA